MLLPAGGAKGFGLALVIDLICGLLSDGAWGDAVKPLYGDPAEPYDCSFLLAAIDIAHFRDPAGFAQGASAARERLHHSARAGGGEPILAPGERKWARRQASRGLVRLPRQTFDTLTRLAAELVVETLRAEDSSGT